MNKDGSALEGRPRPVKGVLQDHALEASDVEGTIVLEEAQVDELVVNREPVDAARIVRVSLGGGTEAVEDFRSGCW